MTPSIRSSCRAGTFRMGSSGFYPEEEPVREAGVDRFSIDRTPVTVGQFTRFTSETGYMTVAERPLDAADYPEADPSLPVEGSIVFDPTTVPVPLDDPNRWWNYVPGANWRRPWGPASDNSERQDHPVTHVAFEDAQAYRATGDAGSCYCRATRRAGTLRGRVGRYALRMCPSQGH